MFKIFFYGELRSWKSKVDTLDSFSANNKGPMK